MQHIKQQLEIIIKKSKKSSSFTKKIKMEEINIIEEQQPKRPTLLTVVCILSFISIGFSFLGSVSQMIKGPQSEEQMLDQKVELTKTATQLDQMGSDYFGDAVRKMIVMTENLNENYLMVNLVGLISLAIGFFGVLKMYKGFKVGFHFYIVYSLITIGQIYLFVGASFVPSMVLYWNLFISGLFVFLYSRNLNWMK